MAGNNGVETSLIQEPRFRMPSISKRETVAENPNQWFAAKFPHAVATYGPAFMEATLLDPDGFGRFIPAYLNDDFFAAILGGDPRLGHRVIYFAPEERFYFFDWRVAAFCPTSEEKLKLLVSNYLLRCSQECAHCVDITSLVIRFRKDEVLNRVVTKAKALLEADAAFFSGKSGKHRMVNGKIINPLDASPHEIFVKNAIVQAPNGALTVTECYHQFYLFCRESGMIPPPRAEFQSLVVEAIRCSFNVGLRHDVPGNNGKQANGWMGIACRSLLTPQESPVPRNPA